MIPRARILAPLFVGFLVLAMTFVAIGYVELRTCTIDDCVHYAYGLNSLIADDLDLDHVNDYIEQGRAPGLRENRAASHKLRDACPEIVFLYVYQIGVDGCTEDVLKRADAAMYEDKVAMKAQRRD